MLIRDYRILIIKMINFNKFINNHNFYKETLIRIQHILIIKKPLKYKQKVAVLSQLQLVVMVVGVIVMKEIIQL